MSLLDKLCLDGTITLMVTAITKANMIPGIWDNFYDRLSTDVLSITMNDTSTVTVQHYANSFGDERFDNKSEYPIMVINTPAGVSDSFTQTKEVFQYSIDVDVYATQKEAADRLLQAVLTSIDAYKPDLASVGIRELHFEQPDYDHAERAGIRVHLASVTITFKYYYTKTTAW